MIIESTVVDERVIVRESAKDYERPEYPSRRPMQDGT